METVVGKQDVQCHPQHPPANDIPQLRIVNEILWSVR